MGRMTSHGSFSHLRLRTHITSYEGRVLLAKSSGSRVGGGLSEETQCSGENLATTRLLRLTRVVSIAVCYQLAWEASHRVVKISGQEPQRAGFKSRSVITCSETLGKSFNLSQLPFPHPHNLYTRHKVVGETGGIRGSGGEPCRVLGTQEAATSGGCRV